MPKMELKIFIVLFCALFTGGHALQCYECLGLNGSCVSKMTTCPDTDECASVTMIQNNGGTEVTIQYKGCRGMKSCISGSVNLGAISSVTSTQCCNTDLCNSKDAPVYSSKTPNGKQCYYCDDATSCLNKLNCSGEDDHCITAIATNGSLSVTVKGCASKSLCDAAPVFQVPQMHLKISCCQGSLCNGAKSVTQNLLFLLWPLFFYILIH
ncbi:phospholipase A2 inhibitor and Ly6/PLAUR domain-containing protein-like [Misgurnus anguillicaudatus]|uniref:phospholipase A2 inhibitor and Ly6/PLAUR domain-containing protein-like n=1 Tax=Misgurnus anguillicaudatus TaxID=75329 RepID=UPI003CCF8ABD